MSTPKSLGTYAFRSPLSLSRVSENVVFLVLFLLLSWFYGYFELLHKGPLSVHQWRQADCASLAMNYYHNNLNFFHPGTHNVLGDNGEAVSEFPIFYYLTAIYYKVFGVDHGVLRVITWLIFGLGLWGIFRLSKELTKDLIWAVWISFMLMGTPLLAYYGFNFLSDLHGLGIMYWSWWLFYRYYRSQKLTHFYQAALAVSLAGMLKPSVLISFVALGVIFLAEWIGRVRFRREGKLIFSKPLLILPGFIIVVAFEALWVSWVWWYNTNHHAFLFWPGTYPIWEAAPQDISMTISRIQHKWAQQYYHWITHILIMALLLITTVLYKQIPRFWRWFTLLSFIGVFAYAMLWFTVFYHHDYYIINTFVFPPAIFITGVLWVKNKWPRVFHSWITKSLAIVFMVANFIHVHRIVNERYAPQNPDMRYHPQALYDPELKTFLQKRNIVWPTKVVSIGEHMPNVSLYYLDLKGVTDNSVPDILSPEIMDETISKGFDYLITNRLWGAEKNATAYMGYPVDSFRNEIFIYDLRPYRK